MVKQEKEFFDPRDIEWIAVEGYPLGIYKKPLSVSSERNIYTNIVKWEAGVETHETLAHDTWEEVFVLEGELIDTKKKLICSKGMYACRPPGMKHGPYKSPKGCLLLEIRHK